MIDKIREALEAEAAVILRLYTNYFINGEEFVVRSERVRRKMRKHGIL